MSKFSASPETASSRPKKSITPPPPTPTLLTSSLPQISITCDKLPSLGRSYPENTVIQYRPYTFGEIKKVSQSKLDTKSSLEFVLLGIETEFDKTLLTVGDFFYLGLLRRISTLGSDKVDLPYKCGGCKKISKHTTETTNIDFEEIKVPELPVIVEFSSREVEFNPLTIGSLFELIELGKHSDEIALLAKQVSNIEFDEAYNFINNANPTDSKLINEVDKLLYHSTKEVVFKCKEILSDKKICGHENKIELEGGQALLIPFREREESIGSKIHFGKSSTRKPN